MEGIQPEQLMSHYITRIAVATVAKYDQRDGGEWVPNVPRKICLHIPFLSPSLHD